MTRSDLDARWILVALLVAPLAACGLFGPDGGPDFTEKTIGPDGGTIRSEGVELDIPAGALDSETDVQMEVDPDDAPRFGELDVRRSVELRPAGTTLDEPATLTVETDEGEGSDLRLVRFNEDFGAAFWRPGTRSPEEVSTEIMGFSYFILFPGNLGFDPSEELTYSVSGLPTGATADVGRAIRSWTSYIDGMTFSPDGDGRGADLEVLTGRMRALDLLGKDGVAGVKIDGTNVIVLRDDRSWFLTEAAQEALDEDGSFGGEITLERAVQHEFGHSLGIWGHNDGAQGPTVMRSSINGLPMTIRCADLDELPDRYDLSGQGNACAQTLEPVSPHEQLVTEGTSVPEVPAVRAIDDSGNPVPGATVLFYVFEGSGDVTGGVKQTGPDGVARAGGWTLDAGASESRVLARARPFPQLSTTFIARRGQRFSLDFEGLDTGSHGSSLDREGVTFRSRAEGIAVLEATDTRSQVICSFVGQECTGTIVFDFDNPASELTFDMEGDDEGGTIATVDIFRDGQQVDSRQVSGDGDLATLEDVDLTEYSAIDRLVITPDDPVGLGYDNVSFQAAAAADAASKAGAPGPVSPHKARSHRGEK